MGDNIDMVDIVNTEHFGDVVDKMNMMERVDIINPFDSECSQLKMII